MRLALLLRRPFWAGKSPKKAETPFETAEINEIEDILDEDIIRARGVQRYKRAYNPPENVEDMVFECLDGMDLGDNGNWKEMPLKDTAVKFQVLNKCKDLFKHSVPNSHLHEMNSLQDVLTFYATPQSNISVYDRMARFLAKPRNLVIKEQPDRFHPEDTDEVHGGINAFPGMGGKIFGLRNKRLYREWTPKTQWAHYQDNFWDYTVEPPENAPWTKEEVRRMDRPRNEEF